MRGWVYIITNKAMPGLVKVGYTMKDPELRAKELYHTGAPHLYNVEYDVLVKNPREIEQQVHRYLNKQKEGKEWFMCTIAKAIDAIKAVAGTKIILENIKHIGNAKSPLSQQSSTALELDHCTHGTALKRDIPNHQHDDIESVLRRLDKLMEKDLS